MQQVGKISSLNPQLTYSYIVRDTFYQLVPTEFKQYYFNNIRLMLNWYQGYVPEFHDPRNGIFSTRIANSIIKEITKLIVGGKVFFANKYREKNPKNLVNPTLENWHKWVEQYDFQEFVKKLVEYTSAGGTSAIVATINNERDLFPRVFRIDQFFHTSDFSGKVLAFKGFIKSYTAEVDNGNGRTKDTRFYYLLEERYYNENDKPVMKINVKQGSTSVVSAQSFDINSSSDCVWEQLPKGIRSKIKRDYGNSIRIGQEIPITLKDLGVIIAKYTSANTIPEVDLGESAIANVISLMVGYEQAYAEMITDLYLARGKVLLPQQMNNPQDPNNSYYSDLDGMLFTKMPYMGEAEQTPISIQFELRAEEWVRVRNNFVETIASQIGVSGSDLFSFLKDASGSSKTATQIASEAQKTISYIEEKRTLFSQYINRFINLWKDYYNVDDDFGVKFSSQNHVNMLVTTEQVRVMHEVGFDYFTIFSKFFTDLDDAQILEMVERKYEQERRMAEINAEVNVKAFDKSQVLSENKQENPENDEVELEE